MSEISSSQVHAAAISIRLKPEHNFLVSQTGDGGSVCARESNCEKMEERIEIRFLIHLFFIFCIHPLASSSQPLAGAECCSRPRLGKSRLQRLPRFKMLPRVGSSRLL